MLESLADTAELEVGARRLAGRMAACLQGALLVQHAPAAVADAFCATRLGTEYGGTLGTLPRGTDLAAHRRPHHPGRLDQPLRAPHEGGGRRAADVLRGDVDRCRRPADVAVHAPRPNATAGLNAPVETSLATAARGTLCPWRTGTGV